MNNECKKEWTRKYINTVFTGKFVNGPWKANQENILFEREKALLPVTQDVLERINEMERNKEKINELNKKMKDLKWEKDTLKKYMNPPKHINTEFTRKCKNGNCPGYLNTEWKCGFCNKMSCSACYECKMVDHTCNKEVLMLVENIKKTKMEKVVMDRKLLQVKITQLTNEKTEIERAMRTGRIGRTEKKRLFTRGCPDVDCRGFLNEEWLCGLCEKTTCKECHLIKKEDHECNADDIATAKLLKSDTKPCPKCSTGIYKIDGCDQMWCTQCHTAFSWKTGELQTNIHNPHYFEWQRRNGQNMRNPLDIICGQEINHQLANSIRQKLLTESETTRNTIDDVIKNTIHIRLIDMPEYRVGQVVNNQKLRIGYLRKEIDDDEFKKKVQRNNKMNEKKREIHEILQLYVQTATDIMYRLNENPVDIEKYLEELEGIRVYTNECLEDIANTYKQNQLILSKNMRLVKKLWLEKFEKRQLHYCQKI